MFWSAETDVVAVAVRVRMSEYRIVVVGGK